jgi:hypothetical protein
MARISRAHPLRLALATCAATAFAGLSLGAPVADAGVLGALTGQVEEVASQAGLPAPPLQAAAESVTPPVETATAPVEKAIVGAAAEAPRRTGPAADVPRTTPPPSGGKPGALPGRAASTVAGVAATAGTATRSAESVAAAAGTATRSADGAVAAAGTTTRSADGVIEAARNDAEAATGTTLPSTPAPTGMDADTTADTTAGPDPGAPQAADPAAAPTDLPRAQRNGFVPSPAENGATGAPLPRWIAYVWPAVALTGPYLASIGEHLAEVSAYLAAGPSASSGGGASQGVAGVHASGGAPETAGSSPLFQRITSAGGDAFASVPTPALVYLGLLALAVIAVGLAVRREISSGRGS